MEIAARLVQELDQSPAANGTVVRMFKIEHADVAEVVDALAKVFASPVRSAARRQGRAGAASVDGSGDAAGPAVVARDAVPAPSSSRPPRRDGGDSQGRPGLDQVRGRANIPIRHTRQRRRRKSPSMLTEVVKSKERTGAAEEPPVVSGDASSNALVLPDAGEVDELIAMARKLDRRPWTRPATSLPAA